MLDIMTKGIPKKSIDETQLERAKWRWEFLRLNDEYIKDCPNWIEQISDPLPCQNKYGIFCWINPELTFDQYLNCIADEISKVKSESLDKDLVTRWLAIHNMGGPFLDCVSIMDAEGFGVTLSINLLAPDEEIKEIISSILVERRGKISKRRPQKTLENCLKAVALKKAGKTPNEIAAIMFPQPDPFSDDGSVWELDEDAVMRKVFRYIKQGEQLVNGGYRDI